MEQIPDSTDNFAPINCPQKNDSNDILDEWEHFSLSSDSEGWETASSKKSNKKISNSSNLSVEQCQIKLDQLYNNAEQRTSRDSIQKAKVLLNNLNNVYEQSMNTPLRNIRKKKALFARDENGYYDLHGFSKGTAYYFLRKKIREVNIKDSYFNIIPGKGLHSINLGNEQPLMLVIQEICNECNFEYSSDEHNEGAGALKRITRSQYSNTSKNQMRLAKSTSFSSSTNSTPKHSNVSTPLKNKSIGRNASDKDYSFETTESDNSRELNAKNPIYSEQKEISSAQCSERITPQQNALLSIEKDDSILKHSQDSSIETQTVMPEEYTYRVGPTYQPPMHPAYQQPIYPAYQQPMYPAYQQPMYPAYQQPMHPAYQQPMHPAYQQPMHPAYQQPMHPAYQQPMHSMQYGQPTVWMPALIMHYTLTIPHQYSSGNLPPPSFQHQEFNQHSREANQKPPSGLPASAPAVSFKKLSQSTTPFFNNHLNSVHTNHTDDPNNNPSIPK